MLTEIKHVQESWSDIRSTVTGYGTWYVVQTGVPYIGLPVRLLYIHTATTVA